MSTILLVDDEPVIRFGVGSFLRTHGFDVVEAESSADAESQFRAGKPDLTILDYRLPDEDGVNTLARLRRIDARSPVVMLTGHGSIDLAVQAVKAGAEHLLTKPVDLKELLVLIRRLLGGRPKGTAPPVGMNPFIGTSAAIRALAERAELVAASDRPTLILGETGVGKGVLARWLAARGPRAGKPFVDLNCAGLSPSLLESELFGHERGAFTGATARKEGLFEAANGGTLFLDEFGELEITLQPKLLKAVEEQRFRRVGNVKPIDVDVRLIAATNADLRNRLRDGTFRADLYFRVSTMELAIPSLRQRREDILPIALAIVGNADELSADAMASLCEHDWPGNIRELTNVLERARLYAGSGQITASHIVLDRGSGLSLDEDGEPTWPLDEIERRHIERAMIATEGNVDEAAALLRVPRSTLYHKLKRYRQSKNETR